MPQIATYLGFSNYLSLMYEFYEKEIIRDLTHEELRVLPLEHDLYWYFIEDFTSVVKALNADRIYVDPPKELGIQERPADREAMIVNELTHLGRGEAKVRLPKGEYIIKTNQGGKIKQPELQRKKDQILAYTRKQYCSSRSEVEQEIASRIKSDEPPATQRKHTLS